MKNQQQDSLTPIVGQNAAIFPDRDTVKTPFTLKGAKATSHFLEMVRAAQARQANASPPSPIAVDAFLKQECSELDKIMGRLVARRDAEAAQAAKREARKSHRELRAAAAQEAEIKAVKHLSNLTPWKGCRTRCGPATRPNG